MYNSTYALFKELSPQYYYDAESVAIKDNSMGNNFSEDVLKCVYYNRNPQ